MSAQDGTAPTSSGFGIWTLLRIAGIIVGVATLLRLATIGFGVEYKEFFKAFLDSIANIVELGFLIDPLERTLNRALDWLHGLGWTVPGLGDHWRPVFALLWLLMLSWARNEPGVGVAAYVTWAFMCSLATGIATGLFPLDTLAVSILPLAGYGVFLSGLSWIGTPREEWTLALIGLAATGLAFVLGFSGSFFEIEVPSRGLLDLAIFVGGMGFFSFTIGLFFLGGVTWHRLFNNRATAMGLDILSVMGLALAIGYVMMK